MCVAVLAAGRSQRMGFLSSSSPSQGRCAARPRPRCGPWAAADVACVVTGAYHEPMARCSPGAAPPIWCWRRRASTAPGPGRARRPGGGVQRRWSEGQAARCGTAVRFRAGLRVHGGADASWPTALRDGPHLNALIDAYGPREGAGAWRPTTGPRGTRSLVDRALFDEPALEGDEGVRALLRAERAIDVCPVRFDEPRLFETPTRRRTSRRLEEAVPMARRRRPLTGASTPSSAAASGATARARSLYLTAPPRPLSPRRSSTPKSRFLRTSCANIHRGPHLLAEEAPRLRKRPRARGGFLPTPAAPSASSSPTGPPSRSTWRPLG